MTQEKKRIAIAEACGWVLDHINRHAMYYVPSMDCHVGDPLNDLNACHAFEATLSDSQKIRYYHNLALWREDTGEPTGNLYEVVHATAAQRCDAFTETICILI